MMPLPIDCFEIISYWEINYNEVYYKLIGFIY